MAEQNRTQQANKKPGSQKSSQSDQNRQGRERDTERTQGDAADESSSVANDRGRGSDKERRDVNPTRDSDELGSGSERETGISENDDEDMGGTGRRNR